MAKTSITPKFSSDTLNIEIEYDSARITKEDAWKQVVHAINNLSAKGNLWEVSDVECEFTDADAWDQRENYFKEGKDNG